MAVVFKTSVIAILLFRSIPRLIIHSHESINFLSCLRMSRIKRDDPYTIVYDYNTLR